jgi:hypothetical protein
MADILDVDGLAALGIYPISVVVKTLAGDVDGTIINIIGGNEFTPPLRHQPMSIEVYDPDQYLAGSLFPITNSVVPYFYDGGNGFWNVGISGIFGTSLVNCLIKVV